MNSNKSTAITVGYYSPSCKKIQKARDKLPLQKRAGFVRMEVANIEDLCYMSTYTGSEVLTSLNAIYNLELDKRYYQPKELNRKLKKILK